MKKKPISLDERKKIQLEMLKEIDTVCRANNIKYSLAFGTLLGAIRHKGFIPWDDDVDIMMPLLDMLKFKEMFRSQTMEFYSVDNDKDFQYAFARIANKRTYNKKGMIASSYGICIDLYPIVPIPGDTEKQSLFWDKALAMEKKYRTFVKWNDRAIRYFPVKRLPGFHHTVKTFRNCLFNAGADTGNSYYIIAGPLKLREKMTYDFDLFEKLIDVSFENFSFCCISCYNQYLRMRYGNYMQLPPEDQRHPYHGGNYYWK